MTLRTRPFDAAKHFTTKAAQAGLRSDALISGDAGYMTHAQRTIARAQRSSEPEQEAG